MFSFTFKLVASLLLVMGAPSQALDVYLDSFECNEELAVRAVNFAMLCGDDGDERCTFGDSVTLEGQLEYNGVADAGVNNGYVYINSDLKFFTVTYHLFEDVQMSLCHNNIYLDQAQRSRHLEDNGEDGEDGEDDGEEEGQDEEEGDEEDQEDENQDEEEDNEEEDEGEDEEDDEEGEEDDEQEEQDGDQYCPGDGLYSFSMSYTLPGGDGSTSWLATGWRGKGIVAMYSTQGDEDSLVGYCTMKLGTAVSSSANGGKMGMPSASTTFAIVAAAVALLSLCCCGFCFCLAKRRQRRRLGANNKDNDGKTAHLTQHDYGAESDGTSTIETRRDDGQSDVKLY
uniref:DOMON domain-containing protein n=1 Tax=Grammatophora oceanica TaxID=210454 RepID=A0A7S1USF2_9STRA|eukprot:CAMPEP_0194070784 /NCGR_PEP_ID=MMETSP0009_2-20130614/88362_1 /TAXON_ID=210454 /ORGANISM="Grammatophora oceanica, Strain CCMP 410" /LENGTH=340 /DNA_ID=CAMNT_0038724071 /DNA_START=134 /DNA_END=1156 /DNA_ORIENTATION=-